MQMVKCAGEAFSAYGYDASMQKLALQFDAGPDCPYSYDFVLNYVPKQVLDDFELSNAKWTFVRNYIVNDCGHNLERVMAEIFQGESV